MEQEFNAGEWIADRVLASLGEDPEAPAQGAKVTSGYPPSPYNAPTEALESFHLTHAAQPVSEQTAKAEITSLPPSLTSTLGTPHGADLPSGLPSLSTPDTDPTVRDYVRLTALKERPADVSVAPMEEPPGHLPTQLGPSLRQNGPNMSTQGPFSGQINLHGLQAMGGDCDGMNEAAQSEPKAILAPMPVKVENSRIAVRNEPGTTKIGITRHDLNKWPCRRCRFVHRGSECEMSCIGCRSTRHDKHELACPFKGKVRQDENLQVSMETKPMSLKGPPLSRLKAIDSQISSTMQLSLECQRRGFNPEFRYYRGPDEWDNRADLFIKNVLISGGGISYNSQKEARDALAPKGLEVVRKMGFGPGPGGPDAGKVKEKPSACAIPNLGSKSVTNPTSTLVLSSRSQRSPYNRHEKQARREAFKDPITDLINLAQSSPHRRERPANGIISSAPSGSNPLGRPQQRRVYESVAVELPANIEPRAAQATVERALSKNPQTNISLHFPANVSVEIAQAYGLAISALATSSRRRSRSRSPVREIQRGHRERERERDMDRSRFSMWPQRTSMDAYRPSPHAVQRYRVEDFRPRLSPPPESKYYPPHDRRDQYSRGRLDLR